jgi:hypothetical protein
MLDPLTAAEIQALRLKLIYLSVDGATKPFDLNASPLTRNSRNSSKETILSFGKSWQILLNNLKRQYVGRRARQSKRLRCIFLQGFVATAFRGDRAGSSAGRTGSRSLIEAIGKRSQPI